MKNLRYHDTSPPSPTPRPDSFPEADQTWELERLYKDLAAVKGKRLKPVEKRYLHGLLCGYSPEEIAGKLYRQPGGVTAYLSRTVYQYVKELTGHDKMRSYEDISKWLGENYRRSKPGASSSQQQESIFEGELSMTIMKSVAVVGVFNNCRITIDRQQNTVKIESNHVQLEASPLPEKNKTGTD